MRLEALPNALHDLFGPRLSFGPAEHEWLPVLWDSVEESRAWLGSSEGDLMLAARLLDDAHDAALVGLGWRGEHPGPWVTALSEVGCGGAHFVLRLRGERGVFAQVRVPLV